ncbi:POT family proton-dependent oligopeptide transporter [Polymorphobacter multimanifer]|uniref:POT family proton-dependent oligopeptide transporter n=1 Tax=Polymorphobacter multimanifer TaxID=1070431 RepID=A0A841LCV4_9SPHN|nr:peptide MFS transporter [Polymorphobacter multimanifer]MBB6227645.1 POT family proton-dependent oligopeptide transporter [Polymorphobacter multimanifer]
MTESSAGNGQIGGGIVDTRPQWFGHPAQLARLFTTEAMERFGYYGMRALLTLYLADHFLFSDTTTTSLYGGFTALVYLTPLVGGLIADRYLGSKRSVKFGAIMMACGYFILCFGGEAAKPFATIDGTRYEVVVEGADRQQYVIDGANKLAIKGNDDGSVSLTAADGSVARTVAKGSFAAGGDRDATFITIMLIGLSAVTVGNGFFKPNISTMVGSLYAPGDRRRDSGFTIFYMGINLGSLASQLACPFLADRYGWWAGFLLAAIGMTISWALIQFAGPKLAGYGEPPAQKGPDRTLLIYVGAILAVPLFWFLFTNLMDAPAPTAGQGIWGYILGLPILGKVLFATFLLSVIGIPLWSWRVGTRQEFQMMLAAIVLIVFNVVFWTLFEQAGSSLTLFADRNTDLSIFGLFSITAGQTQFFNALFIVLLAPVFGALWLVLAKRGREPGIPVKFGMALMGVGAGFLFLVWGTSFAGPDFKVGIWWLAGLYLIHSMAELLISPVGLSMVTKLSIARIVGMMMGVWFLSISCAQYVAGVVAQVASVETVGGQVTNLRVSLETYAGVFTTIGWTSVAIGLVLLGLSPLIKRWMHGVN